MDYISQEETRSNSRDLEERIFEWYLPYCAESHVTATPDKKLVLFYLANDVVQVSRRRGNEFVDAFRAILGEVVSEFCR
jgi:hypothetical protein